MQSYIKNRVKLRELIQFKGWMSASTFYPRSFNRFRLYFAQTSFTDMKSTFIKTENEPLPRSTYSK